MSAERYARIREGVNTGKIRCGSDEHLEILDIDVKIRGLRPRPKEIVLMGMQGFAHLSIAEAFGISRSRVTHHLNEFFYGGPTKANLTLLAKAVFDPDA